MTLRIAWLLACAHHYQQAVPIYRRARTLPGAGPEATTGLASALAKLGVEKRAHSDDEGARAAFREALELNPDQREARSSFDQNAGATPATAASIESWLAYQGKSVGAFSARGAAASLQVTVPLGEYFRARVAYRYVQWLNLGPRTAPTSDALRQTSSAQEIYAAMAAMADPIGAEIMPLAAIYSDAPTSWGAAGRAWWGQRLGASAEGATLRRDDRWAWQGLPSLYVWPFAFVGFSAGPRITVDGVGTDVSWTANLGINAPPFVLSFGAHWGPSVGLSP